MKTKVHRRLTSYKDYYSEDLINISVLKLPFTASVREFDDFFFESGVRLTYTTKRKHLGIPDVIILPGSVGTVGDLMHLRRTGLDRMIFDLYQAFPDIFLVGICGGYQMLGEKIYDYDMIEADRTEAYALGYLPVNTFFFRERIHVKVRAKAVSSGIHVKGYEFRYGRAKHLEGHKSVFKVLDRENEIPYTPDLELLSSEQIDGAVSKDGRVWGSYIHGLFKNFQFRKHFLNKVKHRKQNSTFTTKKRRLH